MNHSILKGQNLTPQELCKFKNNLDKTPGTRVGDLRFEDLMWPSLACHGIYAFCEGDNYILRYTQDGIIDINKYWYIGKASGTALIARIASHFAPRSKDFANSLLKHIAYSIAPQNERDWIFENHDSQSKERKQADEFLRQAFPIIQDLKLKVIIFEETYDEEQKLDIGIIESALINDIRPAFNYPKRFKNREFVIIDKNNQPIKI